MFFTRILSRKTRTSVRTESQDELIEIVRADQDTARRLEACRRISRLTELRSLADRDVDAGVREIAQARYLKLLCGLDDQSPSREKRLAEIASLEDQQHLEHAASRALEAEVRRAAMERLTDPAALAVCALEDPVTANRGFAAERLEDKGALEQVVRRIGKKDKNVYRIARRKLKDIAEREALPKRIREQCAALCEKVERLGRYGSWVQDHALLDLLDRQWAEIESEADQEWGARYRRERDRFLAEYEVYRNEHEAQIAEEEARAVNVATRERLIEELAACVSESDEQTLGLRLKDIELRWTGLELLPDKLQGNLERQYGHAHQEAESRLDLIRTRRKTTARLKKMLETAGKMRNQSSPIDRKRLTTLLDGAKPLLATEGIDKSLREHFAEARRELEEKFRRQVRHAEQRLGQAASKLAELKGTVEAGELKRALPLFQSLHACVELAELSGLPRQRVSGLSDELRALGPPLRELQKWRRYGADTHREGLCQAMTELEHADMPLEAKALRLHDLQMEWKALDKSGSPANQSLWDRFHEASGKVYACCKLFLDQQAESREIARAARQALCMQLEDFLDQVDWERIDWKQTLRAEREMRREWSTMGEVEGRYRRALERRFRAALKRLDDRISAERAENQALKRDLIKRVEALADAPNLDWAIEETKRLQRQWRTTVPARQKEENKLWQRFRTACDSVFDRRRQQHEAEEAELVENLKSREAICAEAEALSQSELNPAVLAAEVRSIEARWNDTEALPLPRRSAGALNQRWRDAVTAVRSRQRQRLDEQRLASLELLARQADVCETLERAVEAGTAGAEDIAAAESAWKTLPSQPDASLQQGIEARYQSALNAAGGSGAVLLDRLADNAKRRAELCLHLEILAQVESPHELTQERLAFQVTRLEEHMRAGEKDPLTGASRLVEDWFLFGPAPLAEASALEDRFARARKALRQTGPESEAA